MPASELKVELRERSSKAELKKMRQKGRVPGVFYTQGEAATLISMDLRAFYKLVTQKVNVFDLNFGKGEKKPSIVREMQLDPIKGDILHVDLFGIRTTEKVNIKVPINLIGVPIGVKEQGGVLEHPFREIEIECLPADIPTSIDVDVSELMINDSLRVEDLNLENIDILSEARSLLAHVVPPKVEEEEEPEAELEELEEGAEPEIVGEKEEEEETEED